MEKLVIWGSPDLGSANTSHVERHNLTMRMSMRRFTRLTNAFSKKLEKHCAALSLYVRPNGALRTKRDNRITPAMAAGIADRPATLEALVELIDARAPKVRYAKKSRIASRDAGLLKSRGRVRPRPRVLRDRAKELHHQRRVRAVRVWKYNPLPVDSGPVRNCWR